PREVARQASRVLPLADFDNGSGDLRIGHGQCLAAKHQRLLGEAIADALWPDRDGALADNAAAAEPDREQVGHAEQGAHFADLDDGISLARKAAAQLPDIA